MCGIAGILRLDGKPVHWSVIKAMLDALRHRGPDDEGYVLINTRGKGHKPLGGADTPVLVWQSHLPYAPKQRIEAFIEEDRRFDLVLGNRRLAILDLSPAGHQPMCNEDGTLWITHNGEIYNFQVLRAELIHRGHRFRSNTDTEVIVHAYEEWGADCLSRFNGMWAFAIWDSKRRKLFCARDRFGVKPFYFYFDENIFIFASEIKALLCSGLINVNVNEQIMRDYLMHGLIDHSHETFFKNVQQLRGGHCLEASFSNHQICLRRYWGLNLSPKWQGASDEEYAQAFYELFEDAVKLRLISDVPVGTCLSGGLDSSSIVCVVNSLIRQGNKKTSSVGEVQRTFSARYKDSVHDEGKFIDAVIKRTKVDARFVFPTADGLFNELKRLIYHQEEPFGSTSVYAQWCVFRLARESGVTVTLDGQGGDELLAGYQAYFFHLFASLLRSLRLREMFAELLAYSQIHRQWGPIGHGVVAAILYLLPSRVRETIRRAIGRGGWEWMSRSFLARVGYEPGNVDRPANYAQDPFECFYYKAITEATLPSLLRYEDKNSMAHSIESRLPFLDYRLVELVASMPREQKIYKGVTKRVLRNAMNGILPEEIKSRRDKIGFSTPEDIWFRVYKDKIREILQSDSFRQRPYFDPRGVQQAFQDHCDGRRNLSMTIWRWINVEYWLRQFID